MVSLLQDQSTIKFSTSDLLDSNPRGDRMQTHEDSCSPVQQENPGFCCQPYDGESQAERTHSESSQSSSPASPCPDHIYGRFSGVHVEKEAYKVPSAAEKFRRYNYEDGTAGTCGRFLQKSLRNNPFHPYKRQFTEETFPDGHPGLGVDGHLFKAASIDNFEEVPMPTVTSEAEMFITQVSDLPSEPVWCNALQYNTPGQEHHSQTMDTDVKLKTAALEETPNLYCFQPQAPQVYFPSHSFHQYSSRGRYPVTYISTSHYPYQRIIPQSTEEQQKPLFPKPIYSYSILIFMALKNSKTGSLPVSEIYNFMTEHFPYFKTAPDGWKNSVRHNLSLNKCFEKVENKSGSSSRKGCLWALNPAKIDKMQEELQKWKRKDPIAVRKSMAKPEELDTLIGERNDRLRSSMLACNPAGAANPALPQPGALQQHVSLCESPLSSGSPHSGQAQGPLPAKAPLPSLLGGQQASCYQAPQGGFPQISPPFVHHHVQQDGAQDLLPAVDTQNGPPGPEPAASSQGSPRCSVKLGAASRPMQDVLMPETDLSSDVDALNPSLTDFDLQGNLWEELKDDSLAIDTQGLMPPAQGPPQCYSIQCQMDESSCRQSEASAQLQVLPDVQLSTLYSAFMELDTGSAPYLNSLGSKPVTLV